MRKPKQTGLSGVDLTYDKFTFSGVSYSPVIAATWDDPAEGGEFEYESVYLTSDPARENLVDYLSPTWLDHAENAIISRSAESDY